jgi:hypothetical protein
VSVLIAAACQGDSIGAAITAVGGFALIGFIVWVVAR